MKECSTLDTASNLVLVAEDDDELRELLCAELELEGYKVVGVTNGDEAVQATRNGKPDVILMDLMMPQKNGIEATKILKDDPGTRHIPIIVGTVIEEKEDIVKGFEAGAIAYIAKPYFMPELKARINSVLQSKKLYDKLMKSEEKYRLLVENANEAILVIQDGMVKFLNPNALELMGYSQDELTCKPFVDFVYPDDREEVLEYHGNVQLGRRACPGYAFRMVSEDEDIKWVDVNGVAIDWEGRPATLNFMTDITARKRTEEEMRFLAFYDCLTGLPNRLMFNEHMDQALAYSKRHNGILATLFLDLDRFKRVNDTFGHHIGDLLLKAVAERLVRIIRKSDILARNVEDISPTNVARFGGDEFVLLLNNIQQAQDAAKVARRILYILADAFLLEGQEIFITTSIGISLYPSDGEDSVSLLKKADKAMYHAKNQGRNNYQFYADSIDAGPSERLALKGELFRALEREELILYYQPQVLLDTKKIIGTEALIRWQHPELGLVPPAEIIPLAEESGLIEPISEWVLRTACRQNVRWQEAGLPPMRMSVNMSSLLLQQRRLVDLISQVLNDSGIEPSHLVIELAESNLSEDEEDSISALRDLKEIGVRIAVDDFGTGNSSLYHLKNYPLDVLKIDRSLIKDLPSNSDSVALTKAIIAMAQSLQIEVIAVGVETEGQLDFLSERGCDALQGYLYGPPVPANDLFQLFREEAVEMRI